MNSHVLGAAVLFGFTEGCILFLVSIGLSLCFGLMRIISLDQCGYYALGAYITYTFTLLTGSCWFGLLIAMIVIAFIGFIIEHVIYKNVYAKPLTYTMIISFGALLLITGLTKYIWGLNPIPVAQPISGTFYIFGLEVPIYRLFIVIVTFLIYIFIYFFLNKTIIGKAIRASIEDVEKVEALGINAYNLFTITFVIACILSGLGGALHAPLIMAEPYMGFSILLYMFITAVLGGLGSVKGTMIAAIIIGETISIGSVVWPPSTIILPFIAFIIVLLIKPTGLFGSKLLKR
jgi:branched-chain amino acid transport system permease protein